MQEQWRLQQKFRRRGNERNEQRRAKGEAACRAVVTRLFLQCGLRACFAVGTVRWTPRDGQWAQ